MSSSVPSDFAGCVQSIKYVVLPCVDMAETRRFYEEHLGLKPDFSDGSKWTQYMLAGQKLCLAGPEECAVPSAGAATTFDVGGDLDAFEAGLLGLGMQVFGRRDMGAHGRMFAARDPAGNLLYFFSK